MPGSSNVSSLSNGWSGATRQCARLHPTNQKKAAGADTKGEGGARKRGRKGYYLKEKKKEQHQVQHELLKYMYV